MIKDIRIVQDHGWLQQPDGSLAWGPTQFWFEYQNELNEWKRLDVIKLNEFPNPNDPLYEAPLSH
jgi:hypothetical protein